MTYDDVLDLILGFLAEDAELTADELREELLAQGREMPIDSLLAVDILVRVQNATGIVLLPTEETAAAMRSVEAFARLVHRYVLGASSTEATA